MKIMHQFIKSTIIIQNNPDSPKKLQIQKNHQNLQVTKNCWTWEKRPLEVANNSKLLFSI